MWMEMNVFFLSPFFILASDLCTFGEGGGRGDILMPYSSSKMNSTTSRDAFDFKGDAWKKLNNEKCSKSEKDVYYTYIDRLKNYVKKLLPQQGENISVGHFIQEKNLFHVTAARKRKVTRIFHHTQKRKKNFSLSPLGFATCHISRWQKKKTSKSGTCLPSKFWEFLWQ